MEKKQSIEKPEFYRILAREAGFTVSDTKDFWNAVERIFKGAIANETVLNLRGFGKLYITQVKGSLNDQKLFWDGIHKKWYKRNKTGKRIVLKISPALGKILDRNVEEEDDSEE